MSTALQYRSEVSRREKKLAERVQQLTQELAQLRPTLPAKDADLRAAAARIEMLLAQEAAAVAAEELGRTPEKSSSTITTELIDARRQHGDIGHRTDALRRQIAILEDELRTSQEEQQRLEFEREVAAATEVYEHNAAQALKLLDALQRTLCAAAPAVRVLKAHPDAPQPNPGFFAPGAVANCIATALPGSYEDLNRHARRIWVGSDD